MFTTYGSGKVFFGKGCLLIRSGQAGGSEGIYSLLICFFILNCAKQINK